MSILVFAEIQDGQIKKSSLEAVSFAKQIPGNQNVNAVIIGAADALSIAELAKYGAEKIYHAKEISAFDPAIFASAIVDAQILSQASWVIISNTYSGKSIAPRIAAKMKAAIVSGVISIPESSGAEWMVKKSCFSGKGFALVNLSGNLKVLALTPNSFSLLESPQAGEVIALTTSAHDADSKTKSKEIKRVTGKIPLTEAEIVVSGGRGMKGPENWGLIEELAAILGGATACSKPVSDMHWRGHDEHVGQTGITIKPNLYIANGISGAIQHLAGVSSSKVIVAINKDPEAPFFKIADYGIVGDVFEVIPQIIEAAKKFKSQSN